MISAVVLTKNQEGLLATCLESIKWVDEIVIVDDDSTNSVLDVARKYTDKIFSHTLTDFASQRNFAMEQVKGDWVLLVDPDERITKQLKEELRSLVSNPKDVVAAAVPRRNYFLGSEQKYVGGWPDHVVRLLKKDTFQGWYGELHEQPKFTGKLVHFKNPLIHLTHTDIESMTQKTLDWSQKEAELMYKEGHPNMTSWRFFRIFLTFFYRWYVKKSGWRAGTIGTIESFFQAFNFFIAYVHLWQMQQKPSLQEKYKAIDQKLLESDFSHP